MTREQAIEIARKVAEDNEWPWEQPIHAHTGRAWLFFGKRYWEVKSKSDCRGQNVRVEVDDATGAVRSKAFLPR